MACNTKIRRTDALSARHADLSWVRLCYAVLCHASQSLVSQQLYMLSSGNTYIPTYVVYITLSD